jgi:hypothetical protein
MNCYTQKTAKKRREEKRAYVYNNDQFKMWHDKQRENLRDYRLGTVSGKTIFSTWGLNQKKKKINFQKR